MHYLRIIQAAQWPVEETCYAKVDKGKIGTGVWSGSGLDETVAKALVIGIERSLRGHRTMGTINVSGRDYQWQIHPEPLY